VGIDLGRRDRFLMPRGDIVLVDLEPVRGSEANKRRPGIIVSNDAANATARRLGHGVVTVVPVTSNIERVYPFQVLLPAEETGLERDSKAQAEQVRSVAVERVGDRLGVIPAAIMREIEDALRLHLDL
jgi:mRNA interferase MazF